MDKSQEACLQELISSLERERDLLRTAIKEALQIKQESSRFFAADGMAEILKRALSIVEIPPEDRE